MAFEILAVCGGIRGIYNTSSLFSFFYFLQIIGSSILFMFDEKGNAGAWMIDFTKTFPVPHGKTINHRDEWVLGNGEDGYLFGVDSLIKVRKFLVPQRELLVYTSFNNPYVRT
jgi:hypothetical protein